MILPLSAIWGGVTNYLLNKNGQDFDGVFDYDVLNTDYDIDTTQPTTFFIPLKINDTTTGQAILSNRLSGATGLYIVISNGNIILQIRVAAGDGIVVSFTIPAYTLGSATSFAFTYDGSKNASGINGYFNGISMAKSVTQDDLTSDLLSTGRDLKIGDDRLFNRYFYGSIGLVENVNFEVTAAQILSANESNSLRAITPYNSGQYLLAIDFDKTSGQKPTTFADTPAYTINAVGGSTYSLFL